jgi:hypothetical protein
VQDIRSRSNGVGAGNVSIANSEKTSPGSDLIGQVGGNSIHTPAVTKVVGVNSRAKGQRQPNFASGIIALLTPWRKRNAQKSSRLRYGLDTEVKNASRLLEFVRLR